MKPSSPEKGTRPVRPEDVMPLFGQLFSRSLVKQLLGEVEPGKKLYWRTLTPLVMMWGLVYQRLNDDQSCDAYVSYVLEGGVDQLDGDDGHVEPVSERLLSESTAAYSQGRQRLPVGLLQKGWQLVAKEAQAVAGEKGQWQGVVVRLLDGTTFTLPSRGDILTEYAAASNQRGASYWVSVRALIACDYFTQAVVGLEERTYDSAETEMVPALLAQDGESGALYVGDRLYGIYRVVQALQGSGHHGLLRLQASRARALLKRQTDKRPLRSGESRQVVWAPTRHDQIFDQWPAEPLVGRLIYLRIEEDGYRPTELYLFTTLLDEERYTTASLCTLYRQRWNVEVRFRHLKTSLELDFFDVRSAAMFRKELSAGILAYNLVVILILQAATRAQLHPAQLSFKKCLRRILSLFQVGVPHWVDEKTTVADWLLTRLARCRLPNQPNKVQHEPRKVRRKPRPYPPLKGSRQAARDAHLKNLKGDDNS